MGRGGAEGAREQAVHLGEAEHVRQNYRVWKLVEKKIRRMNKDGLETPAKDWTCSCPSTAGSRCS